MERCECVLCNLQRQLELSVLLVHELCTGQRDPQTVKTTPISWEVDDE